MILPNSQGDRHRRIRYSSRNSGVLYVGNATDFDTTFNLSIFEAENLTFPGLVEDSNWRCYFNFLGNEESTRLDM